MSAYAAIKEQGFVYAISTNSPEDETNDECLAYEDSSDDDIDDDDDDDDDNNNNSEIKVRGIKDWNGISTSTASSYTLVEESTRLETPLHLITVSDFVPDETNLAFCASSVKVTLRAWESILVSGQFRFKVLSGKVKINNCIKLEASPQRIYNWTALQYQSLPVISNCCVDIKGNTSKNGNVSRRGNANGDGEDQNAAVIELLNYNTGLQGIIHAYPSTSNMTFGRNSLAMSIDRADLTGAISFSNYSFQLILESSDSTRGLQLDNSWTFYYQKLRARKKFKLMAIGGKNTGKSTLCANLLSYMLSSTEQSVVYMELDPGQSDYSAPYCLSLCLKKSRSLAFDSTACDVISTQYYGYTSPIEAPSRYLAIVRKLYDEYESNKYAAKGYPLIVNTPGWIKGFGQEILQSISHIVEPTNLALLTKSFSSEFNHSDAFLDGLQYEEVEYLPAVTSTSTANSVAPSKIRNLKSLMYFHQQSPRTFDFKSPLLQKSPLKLSYYVGLEEDAFIAGVTHLTLNIGQKFDFDNMPALLESQVWAVYAIKKDFLPQTSFRYDTKNRCFPNLIQYSQTVDKYECQDICGLLLIHSINPSERFLNVYAPPHVVANITEQIMRGNKLHLVRGDGSAPLLDVMEPFIKKWTTNSLSPTDEIEKLPYISSSSRTKSKYNGVWKVRRNIQRKGHQRS